MGIMAYSLLWAMQDLYHQPYEKAPACSLPTCCGPGKHDAAGICTGIPATHVGKVASIGMR